MKTRIISCGAPFCKGVFEISFFGAGVSYHWGRSSKGIGWGVRDIQLVGGSEEVKSARNAFCFRGLQISGPKTVHIGVRMLMP